jgi:hypothetical protein
MPNASASCCFRSWIPIRSSVKIFGWLADRDDVGYCRVILPGTALANAGHAVWRDKRPATRGGQRRVRRRPVRNGGAGLADLQATRGDDMDAQYRSASDAAQARVLTDEDPMLQAALEQLAITYSIRKIQEPMVQAALEQVAVIRSIRKILIWTLVVVPVASGALAIVLTLMT